MTGLPSPGRSRVVIIGCSEYDHLPDLPAVRNNVGDLARALRDPRLWGIPLQNCTVVSDDPRGGPVSAANVLDAVRRAGEEAGSDGLLLIYYAGHGLIDESNGHLYLAVTQSEQGEEDAGAVAYDSIRRRVLRSPAAHKMVILDCCYAGRALLGEMSGAGSAEDIEIERSVIIAATSRNLVALAPRGARHTAFTGELLSVLTNGVPDGSPVLDAQTIWREILRVQTAKGLPRPEFRSRNAAGDLPLVRNAWFDRAEERWTAAPPRTITEPKGSRPSSGRRRYRLAGALAGVVAVVFLSTVLLQWKRFDQEDRSAAPAPTVAWVSPSIDAGTTDAAPDTDTTIPANAAKDKNRTGPTRAAKDPDPTDPADAAPDPDPADSADAAADTAEGMCTDAEMSVSPDPESTEVERGRPLEVYLQVMNIGTRRCTRDTRADVTEVYLADGDRKYWSSDTCSAAPGGTRTIFGPGGGRRIKFTWNGRQSSSCADGAPAGPYLPAGSFELRGRLGPKVSAPVTVTIVPAG